MVIRACLLVLFVAVVAGCHGLGPEPQYWSQTPIHTTFYGSSPFNYTLNGERFVRSEFDARGYQTIASAKLETDWLFGGTAKVLTITLDPGNGETIEMQAELKGTIAASYYIATVPQPDSATASLKFNYGTTYNNATGYLNISEFDTVGSTVSGTFSFVATTRYGSDTMRVLAGSFSNIPIYLGGFGQGRVSAFAEDQNFNSTTSQLGATAYAYNKTNGLHIEAHAIDLSGNERVIRLYAENPHVATFELSPNGYADEGTSYQSSTTSVTSGQGTLTITKFDTTRHRLSGTFNFSVPQPYGGTIRITNGAIEDLQWFVL